MPSGPLAADALALAAGKLLGERLETLVLLKGGRNSRVYRGTLGNGRQLALKAYFRHPGDDRDRLGTEWRALSFLWEKGVRSVPQPLAADREKGFALHEFIQGDPPGVPSLGDAEEAADFLAVLHGLRSRAGVLAPASEAAFSLEALGASLGARLARLRDVDAPALRTFLQADFAPALANRWNRAHAAWTRAFGDPALDLPESCRTLSPSDFGFHNALRRDGSLVFLDFEYFGWDDPAKALCDFLLHPGMELQTEARRAFAARFLQGFGQEGLAERAAILLPLFQLKWCLILLNEFLPAGMDRRTFAWGESPPATELQARQLHKAQRMLSLTLDAHDLLAPHTQP